MSFLLLIIYLSFISLGLPDALLGSAWPTIYQQINVPLSYSGIIFIIISLGTVISSLNSDRLTKQFTPKIVTAVSVAMTMIALFGFSFSKNFISLCLWAIPYGLGAGSIDAALNNYVALHYESRHMSWLHCMWGVGATLGPYIMSIALTNNGNWPLGYRIIGFIQLALTIILFSTLSLWKNSESQEDNIKTIPLFEAIKISGVIEIMLSFFCYCAIEQTCGLWAATWLVKVKGIDTARAASFAAFYFLGITIGRFISGFITYKLNDKQMVRLGESVILLGLIMMFQPFSEIISLLSLIVIGLGCAPIYPSLIHATPILFGKDRSQSIIGIQMASAYVGNICMPPLFGIIAEKFGINLFPVYITILLVLMYLMHERLVKKRS